MFETLPFPQRAVPPLARIKQRLSSEHIADVRGETRAKLLAAGLKEKVKPGARVAVTAGSRGMGGFVELVSGVVEAVRECGGEPFVIPTMGSHGGATAEGQTEILRRLGVTEEPVGASVRATMHTHALGTTETGAIAHLDDTAATADGVIVLTRTKTHPENTAGVASGLLKMVTVGLGKQAGAQQAHTHGLWDSVKTVPKLTMAKANILFGVAVVENAFRQPVIVEVVPPAYDAFKEADERLLEAAKPHVAKLPFQQLDLLVVDELGKNISGTGMDLNVIGDWRIKVGAHDPDFRRIAVLSLTHASLGNGLGIGLADFTTRRFMDEYDAGVTYVNLLTATEPGTLNTREGPLALASQSRRLGGFVRAARKIGRLPARFQKAFGQVRLRRPFVRSLRAGLRPYAPHLRPPDGGRHREVAALSGRGVQSSHLLRRLSFGRARRRSGARRTVAAHVRNEDDRSLP